MAIRYTKTVRLILNHISEYGFITNKQCASIFYKGNKQALLQAQTKMKLLYDNKIVKRAEYSKTKELVYMLEKKPISEHRMILMNLYAYLYSNFNVIHFKTEESWQCKTRNDAHIILENDDGAMLGLLCEVDIYHKTSKEKMDKLYNSLEVQTWYNMKYDIDYYPSVLIINSTGRPTIKSDKYDVITIDFSLTGIEDLL